MMLMWIALFVLGYGLVSKRLERTMVTPPMVFVVLGLLFGGGSLASLGMHADQRVIPSDLVDFVQALQCQFDPQS
jgi:drug/metabolite transporter (DMT)-like permease